MKILSRKALFMIIFLLSLLLLQSCTSPAVNYSVTNTSFIPSKQSTTLSVTSPYPASILGQVTITDSLQHYSNIVSSPALHPTQGDVFWVTSISIINNSYAESNSLQYWDYWYFGISDGVNLFRPPEMFKVITQPLSKVPSVGQMVQILDCFEVPASLSVNKAQLVYCGQQPYSYGKLSGGGKVIGYDFLSKMAIITSPPTNVATLGPRGITVEMLFPTLDVELMPSNSVIANKVYSVDLYEKGNLRSTAIVSWNQPELNVAKTKFVEFPLTLEEYNAYVGTDVSHLFSVKVHE